MGFASGGAAFVAVGIGIAAARTFGCALAVVADLAGQAVAGVCGGAGGARPGIAHLMLGAAGGTIGVDIATNGGFSVLVGWTDLAFGNTEAVGRAAFACIAALATHGIAGHTAIFIKQTGVSTVVAATALFVGVAVVQHAHRVVRLVVDARCSGLLVRGQAGVVAACLQGDGRKEGCDCRCGENLSKAMADGHGKSPVSLISTLCATFAYIPCCYGLSIRFQIFNCIS